MKRMWTVLAALCLVLIVTDDARAISSPSGIDPRLRFEYEVGQTRQGKPEIRATSTTTTRAPRIMSG